MYWRNSNFQIAFFLAGKCHTADEAYRLLCELGEDRDVAIKNADATRLRAEVKRIKAERTLRWSILPTKRIEARADLLELLAFEGQSKAVYEQGVREREFIDVLIERVKPFRKYSSYPDHEAHQMAQREEWKLKLIHRAKTFLLTSGTIPQDHLETMMTHPDFEKEIIPAIEDTRTSLSEGKVSLGSLPDVADFIKLLGGPDAI